MYVSYSCKSTGNKYKVWKTKYVFHVDEQFGDWDSYMLDELPITWEREA